MVGRAHSRVVRFESSADVSSEKVILALMPRSKKPLTARTADKHVLYQEAVQSPEGEIDFVLRQFKRIRGRAPKKLREDFCGTAFSACEFVSRSPDHYAVGVDLDRATLDWGLANNVSKLDADARKRLRLLRRDVRSSGKDGNGMDVVLAMNFSYWIFPTRDALRGYFKSVRESLAKDGLFYMDCWGGYESMKEQKERRRCAGFTYVWEQAGYDPVSGMMTCHIHFEFKRGPKMERAFTYVWRLWTVPEIRELLAEAGFSRVRFYGEGDDRKGGGNGVFREMVRHDADASFIAYLVAEV